MYKGSSTLCKFFFLSFTPRTRDLFAAASTQRPVPSSALLFATALLRKNITITDTSLLLPFLAHHGQLLFPPLRILPASSPSFSPSPGGRGPRPRAEGYGYQHRWAILPIAHPHQPVGIRSSLPPFEKSSGHSRERFFFVEA